MTAHLSIPRKLRIFLLPLFVVTSYVRIEPQNQLPTGQSSRAVHALKVVISTDQKKYSLRDSVELNVALRNEGEAPVYIDRRIELGYGAGLKLDIRNEQGTTVPSSMLLDAIMPPPPKDDPAVLVRLDEACFYGILTTLAVKDFFHSPGKYTIRVTYKSWLRKEYLEPRLRTLAVIWWDDAPILSGPISIEVTP